MIGGPGILKVIKVRREKHLPSSSLKADCAIETTFNPDNINCGTHSDKLPHFHMHRVPKYTDVAA